MSDEQPFYAPDKRAAPPRQAKPGEHLWTFTRGNERRRAEFRDCRNLGVELQMFVNDELESGQRFVNRELASLAADAIRDAYAYDGWTCSGCAGELWVRDEHPDKPDHHDSCAGPSIPCPACNTREPPRSPRGFVSDSRPE